MLQIIPSMKKQIGLSCLMMACIVILMSCDRKGTITGATSYHPQTVEQCKDAFAKARLLQKNEKYDSAITYYKKCLKYESADARTRDSLSFCISNALLQMMNSYQACGKISECAECFRQMYQRPPTAMIREYFMRDLCTIYAYALYRNVNVEESKAMIRQALGMHDDHPTHEQLFRDYSFAAAIYYNDPENQKFVMQYGLKALKESEYCEHTSGAQWLITTLAYNYDHKGEIRKAIALHERAIKVAQAKHDTLGEVHAYNALSTIYIEWGLSTYANDCASLAVNKMKGMNRYPDIMSTIYIGKASALSNLERYDSMYVFLNRAKAHCKNLPYGAGMSTIDYLEGRTMTERCTGDSLLRGIAALQTVVRKGIAEKPNALFALAKVYIKLGDNRKGEQMLDSLYNLLHASPEPNYIPGANLFALQHYLKMNDQTNILKYSKGLAAENEFNNDRHTLEKLANLTVQINTEKNEQQLSNYKIRAENERLHLDIYIVMSLVAVILLIPIILYRRKAHRTQLLLMNERFDVLNKKMNEMMNQHQTIKKQYSQMISDQETKQNIDNISAEMLKDIGEMEFRRHFELLYPWFLPQLRKCAQKLGPREELVCMLLALGQDANQIARLLFIEYRSVVIAKSSRRKMK